MKRYLFPLIGLGGLLLSACSSQLATQAWLTKGTKINLPTPNLGQIYHDQQLLTFSYGKQQNSLITLVDATPDTITVVGLSTLGIRLFKIEYHDKFVNTEQNIFIKELPPASQILSDIMLSIYSIPKWQQVLPKGWKLVDEKLHRKLFDDKQQLIIDITYKDPASTKIRKPTHIKHYIFGYQIAIQNME